MIRKRNECVAELHKSLTFLFSVVSNDAAVDWRDVGAVTKVHSQGNCGACWAITAVETVESGEFIATGTLNDLSESEVIVCATECEMCSGGWPQEAFDYIMDNNGVPLEEDLPYDGDFLLALTYAYEDGSGSGDNGDGQYRYEVIYCHRHARFDSL